MLTPATSPAHHSFVPAVLLSLGPTPTYSVTMYCWHVAAYTYVLDCTSMAYIHVNER